MRMRELAPSEAQRIAAAQVFAPGKSNESPTGRALARRNALAVAITAATLILAACNSAPQKPAETKPEVKAPESLAGREAFYKVYVAARSYAADVKPFRIESTPSSEDNGHDGKATIWRVGFASATQRGVKPYIWSGSNLPDAPSRGVSPGNEDVYNPSNASTQVFDPAFLKIDSDQAFTEAQKHGGDKVLEKDANTPVIYICDWNHNTNELIWHVIYGSSRDAAKLTVAINASTGEFVRVEK